MSPDPEHVRDVVRTALREDLAVGPDITTAATVDDAAVAEAVLRTRADGVLAGTDFVREVFHQVLGTEHALRTERVDGDTVRAGEHILTVRAPVHGLLMAERTALNLLCHLSGIASSTASWVRALRGTGCAVRDSRKTLPGLRIAQKYAVRCGGGLNHRMGLGDALLVKDNHIAAAGSVTAAVRACRAQAPHLPLEVEVGTWDEFVEALPWTPELVLLDNFTPEQCARAVDELQRQHGVAELAAAEWAAAEWDAAESARPIRLEASGALNLERAREYAETGVDFLAVGGLTHSAAALDIGMDM